MSEEVLNQLLSEKRALESEIKNANFRGYPEVKEINGKKYVYLRYKKYDRLSSVYAGPYDEVFYEHLKDMSRNMRELKTRLRVVNSKLAKCGVRVDDLDPSVVLNANYIRNNINTIIYGQAVVEGVSATFLETEEIIEKGSSKEVSFDDTLTILNLKDAWKYVLDEDTIRRPISFGTLSTIAGFVNDRQISYPDQIRTTRVLIGGSTYRPAIPQKEEVWNDIEAIMQAEKPAIDKAIDLLCYLCKAQVFNNGNKRTALIFANFYLMLNGGGFISIPSEFDKRYKMLLVEFYEGKNDAVKKFLLEECYLPL